MKMSFAHILKPSMAVTLRLLTHGINTSICRRCHTLQKTWSVQSNLCILSRPYVTHAVDGENNTSIRKPKQSFKRKTQFDSNRDQRVNAHENLGHDRFGSVPHGRVLHKRPINRTEDLEDDWSEISKNLSAEDSFGTLDSAEAKDVAGHLIPDQETLRETKKDYVLKKEFQLQPRRNDSEWTSQFGTLAADDLDYREIELDRKKFADDEGEDDSFEQPYIRLAVEGRKHTPNWYGKQIEKLSKEGKVFECVQVLETQMLKEDRVMPNQYVFTVLIGALGRVGYTKKAFSLYNKMKKFGLEPEDPTYTALFNACSNSPWREDGLQRATKLLGQMQEKGVRPNLTMYKAMVKAFGRCGNLRLAFSLVDDLNAAGLRADEEVFSMLLQACISDKETGLRYAIEVCRRLKRRKKVTPSVFHYNLLLRAIRDCEIGDPVLANQLISSGTHDQTGLPPGGDLHESTANIKPKLKNVNITDIAVDSNLQDDLPVESDEFPKIEYPHPSSEQDEDLKERDSQLPAKSWWAHESDEISSLVKHVQGELHNQSVLAVSILDADVPDILGHGGDFGAVVGLGALDTRESRLALFGGLPGMIRQMKTHDVRPDIRTFTLLLDLIPSSADAEQDLLAVMKAYSVDIDVDFLNLVIRKRNLRKDYDGAKDIFSLISQSGLSPNIMSYGCLAMGCVRMADGLQLVTDLEAAGAVPNVSICKILFYQSRMNFKYKLAICQIMERLRILPDEALLTRIENSIERARKLTVLKEKGQTVPPYAAHSQFDEGFELFMKSYKPWLLSMQLDQTPHPWEHFRKATPSDDPVEDT